MTKTQKQIKALTAKLATMEAAKNDADNRNDEAYFYEMVDAIRMVKVELEDLMVKRRNIDSNTRALISANCD